MQQDNGRQSQLEVRTVPAAEAVDLTAYAALAAMILLRGSTVPVRRAA
jgi:hypothetical protein